jgi:hypothetical protein
MLTALGPIGSTDLPTLKAFLDKAEKPLALPSGLDDGLLLSLAKDLRGAEAALRDDTDEVACMAGPLALLLHVLMDGDESESNLFSLALSNLAEAFPVLQLAVEREIVSRVVDARNPGDDANFIQALEKATGR